MSLEREQVVVDARDPLESGHSDVSWVVLADLEGNEICVPHPPDQG